MALKDTENMFMKKALWKQTDGTALHASPIPTGAMNI
jgi:hypothetical protein